MQSFSFAYGYTQIGDVGNPFYEMKSAYLNLGKYYGILSGVASSLSYAVCGLLWAIAAEKYNRKYLITISCLIYSSCSFFSG